MSWAAEEFATVNLGHERLNKRLNKRLVKVVQQWVAGVKSCHLPTCFRCEASRAVSAASQWQLARPDPSPVTPVPQQLNNGSVVPYPKRTKR